MKISFEVDIEKYREAVARGWEREYEEETNPDEITLTNTATDIRMAMNELADDDVKNIDMKE